MQRPTTYEGIYVNWNIDLDGMTGGDDPWDFGASSQYPVLKIDRDGDGTATWQEFGVQRLAQVRSVSVVPGEGALVLSWTAVSGATGYKVQWKSGDEDYDAADRQAVVTDGTTYAIANLIGNTEYTVRVIATHADADDDPLGEATGMPRVLNTEPVFTEAADPQTYRQNQAIALTLPAAIDGNGDEARLNFTLEIPDLMPTFGDTTIAAQSYLVNQRIESLALPQAISGDGTLAYILLPFLPDGLAFDHETRVLSGTPSEVIAEATYTFSAIDADGDVASLRFTLDVSMPSADLDGDGNVNFADFILLVSKYGSRIGQDRYDARCDLNADGQIDFADFLIFAADFGSTG